MSRNLSSVTAGTRCRGGPHDRKPMMDEGMTVESPPQFKFDAPHAEFRTVEPVAPAEPSRRRLPDLPASRCGWWRQYAVASVVAASVLMVLYTLTANDRDQAEQALADSQASLAETEASLADSEASLAETDTTWPIARRTLPKPTRPCRRRADSEANLAETQASLAQSEAQVTEYREVSTDLFEQYFGTEFSVTDAEATCMSEALIDSLGPEALGLLASTESSDANQFGFEAIRARVRLRHPARHIHAAGRLHVRRQPDPGRPLRRVCRGRRGLVRALYKRSGVGTDYETFGLTCGNRFQPAEVPLACEGSV